MRGALPAAVDYNALNELLTNTTVNIDDVLLFPGLKAAVKKQYPPLVDYLKTNSEILLKIALGLHTTESKEAVAAAMDCFTSSSAGFRTHLIGNRRLLNSVASFIDRIEKPSYYNLLAFSRIMSFMLTMSNGFVFLGVQNKERLFENLLIYLSVDPIYDFLLHLSTSTFQAIPQFLGGANASAQLLEYLGSDSFVNERVLKLLTNIHTNCYTVSKIAAPIHVESTYKKIYQMMISDANSVIRKLCGSYILVVMRSATGFDLEEEHTAFIEFMRSKIPEMIAMIQADESYTPGKSLNLMMIVTLMDDEKPPEAVGDLLQFMFDLVFKNPVHSILHRDVLDLFNALWGRIEVVKRCGFFDKIPDAVKNYRQIIATYWQLLYKIAKKISQDKRIQVPEKWSQFMATHWKQTNELLHSDYGGPLPSYYSEYEYSYYSDEEEEEEEEFDHEGTYRRPMHRKLNTDF